MEIPRELFAFSALLFAYVSIKTARKTYEEKTKLQYITLLLMVLSFGWSVLAALDMIEFAAIAWFATMIISLVNLPELGRHIDQQLLDIDLDSPITFHDIISNHYDLWVKAAHRYGMSLAIIGYTIQGLVICGSILLVLDYLYGLPPNFYVVLIGILPTSVYQLYKRVKKRLAIQHKPVEKVQV